MNERTNIRFDKSYEIELDELTPTGKKNAKHAEEIHDEVERTRTTMAAFLSKNLPLIGKENWSDVCVESAFNAYASADPFAITPKHRSLLDFDIKTLAVIMEYNLKFMTFERQENVTVNELREILKIRNAYEHRGVLLNVRQWRKDIEALQVFRAKMQTNEEIEGEKYELSQLESMKLDAEMYQRELVSIHKQIEDITGNMSNINQSVYQHAMNDAEQFQELEKQRDRDRLHDQTLGVHKDGIAWLKKRDKIQRVAIIVSLTLGAVNASLLAMHCILHKHSRH